MKDTTYNREKLKVHCKKTGHVSINELLKKNGMQREPGIDYCAGCLYGRDVPKRYIK